MVRTPVAQGAAAVQDATVVQPLIGDAPAGVHTVVWRVTASDGHPLSGAFTFTVAAGSEPFAATAPAPPPEAVSEAAAQEPVESSFAVGPIAIGAALLAVAGGLSSRARRSLTDRRSRRSALSPVGTSRATGPCRNSVWL